MKKLIIYNEDDCKLIDLISQFGRDNIFVDLPFNFYSSDFYKKILTFKSIIEDDDTSSILVVSSSTTEPVLKIIRGEKPNTFFENYLFQLFQINSELFVVEISEQEKAKKLVELNIKRTMFELSEATPFKELYEKENLTIKGYTYNNFRNEFVPVRFQ